MKRILVAISLLLFSPICLLAQKGGKWASARERHLRGTVQTVVQTCSDIGSKTSFTHKYEFARDGTLMVITQPQFQIYILISSRSFPVYYKITKRNSRGDVVEGSLLNRGELEQKEKYELEYDGVGNWIKMKKIVMRDYEYAGSSWKEGEWQAQHVCNRTIEYYP
ncbi:MAG: hypothetical protein QOH96_1488 [Blastocatellia bacterium]|jgi:hypothetical protein|nr:hypothetical protein [Blastocatellia bacterium]